LTILNPTFSLLEFEQYKSQIIGAIFLTKSEAFPALSISRRYEIQKSGYLQQMLNVVALTAKPVLIILHYFSLLFFYWQFRKLLWLM